MIIPDRPPDQARCLAPSGDGGTASPVAANAPPAGAERRDLGVTPADPQLPGPGRRRRGSGRSEDHPGRLTRRQAEWLGAIRGHYTRTGLSPTLHQLCEATGLSPTSASAAASALRTLAEKGYLAATKTPGGHTRYVPADRGVGPLPDAVAVPPEAERPVALRMRGYAARCRGRLVPGTIGATVRSATEAARRREGCQTWAECEDAGWTLVRVQVRVYRGTVRAGRGPTARRDRIR